jgi:hypothetical protein
LLPTTQINKTTSCVVLLPAVSVPSDTVQARSMKHQLFQRAQIPQTKSQQTAPVSNFPFFFTISKITHAIQQVIQNLLSKPS